MVVKILLNVETVPKLTHKSGNPSIHKYLKYHSHSSLTALTFALPSNMKDFKLKMKQVVNFFFG